MGWQVMKADVKRQPMKRGTKPEMLKLNGSWQARSKSLSKRNVPQAVGRNCEFDL
jgi:hypothetical protein